MRIHLTGILAWGCIITLILACMGLFWAWNAILSGLGQR